MYSLNAPVPDAVARLAASLASALAGSNARAHHTLVVKRLGGGPRRQVAARVREALAGAPACEARVSGVETFDRPAAGVGPVVYLAVESPGLERVHRQLIDEFPPVADIEGDDYVPHVTVARGGAPGAVRDLLAREVEPVEWTVDRLEVWDAEYREAVEGVSLPA